MKLQKEEIKNLLNTNFQTITMHRLSFGKMRGYCSLNPFKIYSGLTTALSSATFKGNQDNKRLDKWRDKMQQHLGFEGQESYLQSMADFGTLCHQAIVKIKQNGKLNWKEEIDVSEHFFVESAKQNNIPVNQNVLQSQVFEYCKAIASIMQWVYDNVTEIHAIEAMCKNDDLMIATPVDIVCMVKQKEGDVMASINIKTSSQIGDHQREQVVMEKYLWNSTYSDKHKVIKTGIIRPKDYSMKKGLPTYEFELIKEEEEQYFLQSAFSRLNLIKNDPNSTYLTFPSTIYQFEGETKIGEIPKIEAISIEEMFKMS